MMHAQAGVIGIDVSKGHLDIAHSEDSAAAARYPNSPAGIDELVRALCLNPPLLVVAEATGGYEIALVRALEQIRKTLDRQGGEVKPAP